ncbi:MAG: hypothetical protein A3H96_11295 [Acidobacteria bacterium RIFCSPLOWO2_02_FULL_67_36]|nr:MAG: hypothetical protein A3H96_11295 [Acidobacteria bacterium RIFCSPLOWO2_02_FULL_67_36]
MTPRVNWTVVITLVAIVVGWMIIGGADNRAIVSRIASLEAQRVEDSRRIERIENKIDLLIQRVK